MMRIIGDEHPGQWSGVLSFTAIPLPLTTFYESNRVFQAIA